MDRPFAANGEKLGVSENAARMRVDRALDTLRAALTRHGITSTTAALALVLTQHAGAASPVGLSSAAIASTACQAAAGAAVAGTAGALVTKIVLGLSAGAAAMLSVALWQQEVANERLARELASLRETPHESSPPAPAPGAAIPVATMIQPAIDPVVVRQVEDDILAAAELAVPLTAEQEERVRLDTIIRKGELDGNYAMLFRQLRLPPHQLDALKALIVERNQAIHDANQTAKEEGLTFASVAEAEEVNRIAVADVDRRISSTIGPGALATLQEYEALAIYRSLAGIAATRAGHDHATDDAAVLSLARALRQAAPGYPELLYQSNGWPVAVPPSIREVVVGTLGADAEGALARHFEYRPISYELATYVRDAVLAGKLPPTSLRGNIAREYEAALAAKRADEGP